MPCIVWGEWVCPLTVDIKTGQADGNGIKLQTLGQDDALKMKGSDSFEHYTECFFFFFSPGKEEKKRREKVDERKIEK